MVFVIDENFVKMWNKHCDVLTVALSEVMIRFERLIKEEVVLGILDINSSCSCIDLDKYIGMCSTEFLDFKHILNFDFKAHGKSKSGLNVKVHFDYEKDLVPFCYNFMEMEEKLFSSEKTPIIKCSEYNYFLQIMEGCNLRFEIEAIDLRLQTLLSKEILDYMLRKCLGELPYNKSKINIQCNDLREYVL